MTNNQAFDAAVAKHMQTLKQYVPVVARVHGKSHPEFLEVRAAFDALRAKIEGARQTPDVAEEFAKLRAITDGYTVPGDVCESYEAVYTMLAQLDKAYHAHP